MQAKLPTVYLNFVHGIPLNLDTSVPTVYADGLGYSRTVPVTLVHGILGHRGAYIMYGRSWIFQDCPSNFGTRDT